MEKFGLEFVVENLGKFSSDIGKAKSLLRGLAGEPTLLQRAFGAVGNAIESFGSSVAHVVEYALGNLLAGAIRGAIDLLGDLVKGTIEAGTEFQTLQLRLETLNFNAATDSGMAYNDAMAESVKVTQEQLAWLQKLSVTTPFDNQDISNIYSLARSYQFADEESRKLTEAVANFTSGMGLSGDTMERIITNLGQMKMQGKITGTELRDLARGAFVPVADVLDQVARNLEETGAASIDFSAKIDKTKTSIMDYEGRLAIAVQKQSEFTDKTSESQKMLVAKTIEDYQKKIADLNLELTTYNQITEGTGTITKEMFAKIRKEGIPAQEFVNAFIDTVNTKFSGSAVKMARTFGAATANMKDLAKSVGGLQIVTPILDVLGEKIAGIVDAFAKPEVWDAFVAAAGRIGTALASIVEELFGLAPTGDQIATAIVDALNKMATWLEENKDKIIETAKVVLEWIGNLLIEIGKVDWLALLNSILGVAGAILGLFGIEIDTANMDSLSTFVLKLTVALNDLAIWIQENQGWLSLIVKLFLGWQVIMTAVNIIVSLLVALVGFAAGAFAFIRVLLVIKSIFLALIATALKILSVFLGLVAIIAVMRFVFTTIANIIGTFVNIARDWMAKWLAFMKEDIDKLGKAITDKDWGEVIKIMFQAIGKAIEFNVTYLVDLFKLVANAMIGAIVETFQNFNWADFSSGFVQTIIQAVKDALGINSPSKVFADIGNNMVAGMAKGIADANKMAAGAMMSVVKTVAVTAQGAPASVPAVSSTRTVNNNQTSNYNLTVNSQARSEPVIADFSMLQSLSGA